MANAISLAAQIGHDFVGTSNQEFGVFIAFVADTPMRTVHRASVQTSLSNIRFTDLFLSLRSDEVCSTRCSVPVFFAAASSYAGRAATLSAVLMAEQNPSRPLRAPMRMPICVALGRTSAARCWLPAAVQAMCAALPSDDDQFPHCNGFFMFMRFQGGCRGCVHPLLSGGLGRPALRSRA